MLAMSDATPGRASAAGPVQKDYVNALSGRRRPRTGTSPRGSPRSRTSSLRAVRQGSADVSFDFLDRGLVDERSLHDAGPHAVADFHRFRFLGELRRENVVDLVLHKQPVRADAGLACVSVLGGEGAFDRGV